MTQHPITEYVTKLNASWAVMEQLDWHLILEGQIEGSYKQDAGGDSFLSNCRA